MLIEQYNNARFEVESLFNGLPHAPRLLVNALITKTSPLTGVVENISYRDLTTILTVDVSPGRKDSGTPTKQAIRNYLCTIETQCGAYFKVSSENQSLKITFPTLPDIYKAHFKKPEDHTACETVDDTQNKLINKGEESVFDGLFNTEVNTQVHIEANALETPDAINVCVCTQAQRSKQITKTNITNTAGDNKIFKQPISPDFYPSHELINHALSQ